MKKAKVVKRPVQPPKQSHCPACNLTLAYLQAREAVYECSRVDCPQRRQITAQPPDHTPTIEGHGKTPQRSSGG